jgi:hypothetical protein
MLQLRTSSAAAGRAPTTRRVPIRTALLALVAAVAVAFTLPAAASAAAGPSRAEKREARAMCALALTRAERGMFRRAYGGKALNRASRGCVSRLARRLASRRGARRRAAAPAPTPPPLPGVPMLPGGIPEMPGVRLECQVKQMEDPIAFAQEFPTGIEMCVMMESMP